MRAVLGQGATPMPGRPHLPPIQIDPIPEDILHPKELPTMPPGLDLNFRTIPTLPPEVAKIWEPTESKTPEPLTKDNFMKKYMETYFPVQKN